MNKTNFNQLLTTSTEYTNSNISELENLALTFPYSSLVHQILLKKLFLTGSFRFESELKKTAIHFSNRTELKKFLFIEQKTTDKEIKHIAQEQNKPVSVKLSVVSNEKESTTFKITESKNSLPSELEDEVIAQAINASISIEVESSENLPQIAEPKEIKNLGNPDKKSFHEWLESLTQKNKQTALERETFRKKAEQLIDQFIINQPKIVPKKEFYSPANMANKSLEEHEELATETLAKIYASQGKTNKALATYERLILKNPEKKAYFAAAIEELNQSKE